MTRLEAMSDRDFRESLDRAVERRAARNVRRGWWTEADATGTARAELASEYSKGLATPDHRFLNVVDSASGARVGEVWTVVENKGGKTNVWVEWISIDPEFRRRGLATDALRLVEEAAVRDGAERIGLYVVNDNPAALALYTKLGFHSYAQEMVKTLVPARTDAPA